ncbi:MAG: DUF2851 family protein [Chloroflexi bacterium]|nr:DUF2851 family protein [Chloroflexota bacterium]MYD48683.1 DUF2851 family protein [Chloroflexota bacterium]
MTTSRHDETEGPGRPDTIPPISEAQLARLWLRRAARSHALRTESGRRVKVLYPGRPGVTAGPDFRNALLVVEGQGLVQGDVEVHLRQRDWQSHGHHNDPNYNGVALHVALRADAEPSRTEGGASPPTVNLRGLLDDVRAEDESGSEVRARLWQILAQHGYRRPQRAEQMAGLLNRAGDARFLSHSRRLQMLMPSLEPEQTLWESVCEALGYRHNRHPFLRLAAAVPFAALAGAARRLPEEKRSRALASCLLQMAGFGSGPPPRGFGSPLDAGEWRLFRVRPPNHPRRRILGAAHLAARFADRGLVAEMQQAAATARPARLTDALTVQDAAGKSAFIGPARAKDVAVNVVLPFLHGRRSLAGDARGAEAMLDLYRDYGNLTDNEITRELATALQEPGWGRVADNARRQQGLIHLQRLLAGAA